MAAAEHLSPVPPPDAPSDAVLNAPNLLSGLRLVGAVAMIVLALYGKPATVAIVFAVSVVTDWFDGKLANLLHQRTTFGARLDSVADSSLYAALLFCFCWLMWDFVVAHWLLILAATSSYLLSIVFSFVKFQRFPSYHTYAAKATWHLLNVGVLFAFLNWAAWPFDLAMASVVLVNLEAMAITCLLKESRVDVRSVLLVNAPPKGPP